MKLLERNFPLLAFIQREKHKEIRKNKIIKWSLGTVCAVKRKKMKGQNIIEALDASNWNSKSGLD